MILAGLKIPMNIITQDYLTELLAVDTLKVAQAFTPMNTAAQRKKRTGRPMQELTTVRSNHSK